MTITTYFIFTSLTYNNNKYIDNHGPSGDFG